MVGLRNRIGYNDRLTLDLEATKTGPYQIQNKKDTVGADTALIFKVDENLFCAIDWVLGGETQSTLGTGAEASLLYCLENGCYEAVIFYLPSAVSKGVRISPGRGGKIRSVLEFKEDTTLETVGYLIDSTPEMLRWSLKGGALTLTKRFGKYRQNSLSGGGKREWRNEETEEGSLEAIETSAMVKYAIRESETSATAKGALTSTDFSLNNTEEYNIKTLRLQADLTSAVSKTILLGVALDTLNTWFDDQDQWLNLEGESELKWRVQGNTIVAGLYRIRGISAPKTDFAFRVREMKIGLSLQCFPTQWWALSLEANRVFLRRPALNWGEDHCYLYTTAGFHLHYLFPDDTGRITGKIDYRSPVGSRLFPQWSYSLALQKFLPSDLMLKCEFERIYDTLWDQTPEDLIRLSIGQCFGVAKGETRAFRYSEEDNISIIKGLVYLDENGNGQFDEWEKRLPGIIMSIDGRRATTNNHGEYIFNFVKPGIYRVDFNPRSLPADYSPVTGEQLIRIRENENFFLDFGVTLNGSIYGRVFIDANANGEMDQGEKPLDWVGVILDHGVKKIFTSQDGSFYFEGVPLGDHTISLDPESLPADLKAAREAEITILLTEEALDTTELLFPLVFKFRE